MERSKPSDPPPEQPEEPAQPQEPSQHPESQIDPFNPPDSETRPGVAENLAAWQRYAQEPPARLGESLQWRPGQSVSTFYRAASRLIAAVAAEEAQEQPDDQAVQGRNTFWLAEVQKREE